MKEIEITLRYDPEVNAASLRLARGPGRVGGNVFVTPPGGSGPDLRLRFDDEGRLYNIESLAADRQLPVKALERLGVEPGGA